VRVRAAPPGADTDAVAGAIISVKGNLVNGEIVANVLRIEGETTRKCRRQMSFSAFHDVAEWARVGQEKPLQLKQLQGL
jgi:hypothetical protein